MPRWGHREPAPLNPKDPFVEICSCGQTRTPFITGSAVNPPVHLWRACVICDLSLRFPSAAVR